MVAGLNVSELVELAAAQGQVLRHQIGAAFAGVQVRKALLRPQVVVHRHALAQRGHRGDFAVLGFEHREQPGFARQAGRTRGPGVSRGRAWRPRHLRYHALRGRTALPHGFILL